MQNNILENLDDITPKKPRYTYVYEILYDMITQGKFSDNNQLPSEPMLAQMLGVSRMTLRQALALLRDDGLVRKIRGKGNFITLKKQKSPQGLEYFGNPIYNCVVSTIQEVEIEFRLEPPNEYMLEHFGQVSPAAVIVDRWYRDEKKFIAYSLGFIPIQTISRYGIDLNEKQQLLNWLEKEIYQKANHASLEIKSSESGDFVSTRHTISNRRKLNLIIEKIYGTDEYPHLFNKHYLSIDDSIIQLHSKKVPF